MEDGVKEHFGLEHTQVHGVKWVHPRVLRDAANVAVRAPSIIWKIMVIGGGSWKWEKGKNPTHLQEGQEGASREKQTGQPPSVPEKMMEQLMLEVAASLVKDKEVTGNSQHGFTKKR